MPTQTEKGHDFRRYTVDAGQLIKVTLKNLSLAKDIKLQPVYVTESGAEEPEDMVDLKCGGEVCAFACVRVRVQGVLAPPLLPPSFHSPCILHERGRQGRRDSVFMHAYVRMRVHSHLSSHPHLVLSLSHRHTCTLTHTHTHTHTRILALIRWSGIRAAVPTAEE